MLRKLPDTKVNVENSEFINKDKVRQQWWESLREVSGFLDV